MAPPRSRPDRIDVLATVGGVLLALAATWGVKVGLAHWRAEEMVAMMTEGWRADDATKLRVGRILERELRHIVEDPRVQSLGPLMRRAPAWMPDGDLATYQSLRKRMALASERACPCFWDPTGCNQGDLVYGLDALSDEEIARWYRLAVQAVRAQLDGAPEIPYDTFELQAGVGVIVRAMSDADRARYEDVREGRATSKADRCFAARALFQGIEQLEPARRLAFTRALVNAGAER